MKLEFYPLTRYFEMAKLNPFTPVVEGLISRKEFLLLHAPGKTGKSLLALNLAVAIASGESFLSFETFKGKVLYLQTELAAFAVQERIERMLTGLGEEQKSLIYQNIQIADARIRIDSEDDFDQLYRAIQAEKPSLVIIDPLYDMHSLNENNAEEMTPLLAKFRQIAREIDCAVILVHHQGKRGEGFSTNPGHQCRGSSAFADVPDISLSLTRAAGQNYSLKGIFRNRPAIEELSLILDGKNLTFVSSVPIPKTPKTRAIILNALGSGETLSRDECYQVVQEHRQVTRGAIKKALEELVESGLIECIGKFKDTKFQIIKS